MIKDTDLGHKVTYSGLIKEHRQQIQVTDDYTVKPYDQSLLVTDAANVLTLPTLAESDGRQYFVRGGTGTVTITPVNSELIAGEATLVLAVGGSIVIESTSLGWVIVSLYVVPTT